MWAIKEIC